MDKTGMRSSNRARWILLTGACSVIAFLACRSTAAPDPDDALVERLADAAIADFRTSGSTPIVVSDPGNRAWVEHLRRGGRELFDARAAAFELLVRGDDQSLIVAESRPPHLGLGFFVFDRNDPSRCITVRDDRIGPVELIPPRYERRNSVPDARILEAARAFVASWHSSEPAIVAEFDPGHERFRLALSQRSDASFLAKRDIALRVLGRGNYAVVSVRCAPSQSEFSHALIVDRSDPRLLFALPDFF